MTTSIAGRASFTPTFDMSVVALFAEGHDVDVVQVRLKSLVIEVDGIDIDLDIPFTERAPITLSTTDTLTIKVGDVTVTGRQMVDKIKGASEPLVPAFSTMEEAQAWLDTQ